jgi:hypothetical protein
MTNRTEQELQLDIAFNQGIKAIGQGELYHIYLPFNDQTLKLRIKMSNEFFTFSWVWVNPYTGG